MQSIHFNRPNADLTLRQTGIPEVRDSAVLVRVCYSGVCGTDLHIMQKEFRSADDVTLGHEFSGVVEKVGKEVRDIKVGDKVAIDPNQMCGACRFCKHGQPNYCPVGLNVAIGICKNGGWADYCEVPAVHLNKLPDSMPLDKAALCEPFSCIVRGWENLGIVPDDAQVLVLGAGIIGLLWASLFHHHGYRDVTITELAEGRRKVAKSLGLGYDVLHPADLNKKFENVDTGIEGYDVIVDCTGAPKAIESAFPLLRCGGKMCLFGCCPKISQITINPADIMLKELTIVGSQVNPFTFTKAVSLVNSMADKYLDFDRLGIKLFSLEEYKNAIETLKRGEIAKAMFCVNKS